MVSPSIGTETSLVLLSTPAGAICQLDRSRRQTCPGVAGPGVNPTARGPQGNAMHGLKYVGVKCWSRSSSSSRVSSSLSSSLKEEEEDAAANGLAIFIGHG